MTTQVAPNAATASPSTPNPTGQINVSPSEGTAPNTDWMAGLNPEFKGYVENKGFKDPSMIVDSYINLEKFVTGAPKERRLILPEKSDDPQWNEIYTKLGRPEKPDGYKIEVPKEGGDENFAKWARETFHKSNLTAKQAEALAANWNTYATELQKQQVTSQQAKVQAENETLQKEWGAAFEQNTNVARDAVRKFGMDEATIDRLESALGYAGVMKFFHTLGSKIGEDAFISGDSKPSFGGALTPHAAQSRIAHLKADEGFTARFAAGDIDALDEMTQLHQMAYPNS